MLERASEACTSSSAYQRGQRLPAERLFPISPLLSETDEVALDALYQSLRQLCDEARRLGVRLDIDAEQSWFQPAIDRYYEMLSQEFNRPVQVGTPSSVIPFWRSSTSSTLLMPPVVYQVGSGTLIGVFRTKLTLPSQTYQCYRTDAYARLSSDAAHARATGVSFGAKLVRGAYVEAERIRAQSLMYKSPIWSTRMEPMFALMTVPNYG